MARSSLSGVVYAFLAFAGAMPARAGEPIIDMHLHASMQPRPQPERSCTGDQPTEFLPVDPANIGAAPLEVCANPIFSAVNADELRERTLGELRRLGVVRAVVMGRVKDVERWSRDAPSIVIPASTPYQTATAAFEGLRAEVRAKRIKVLAEVSPQYLGIRADDPRCDPYWALAQEYDIPVGIHLGPGSALVGQASDDPYRVRLTSPFQLEAVLKKFPRLRLYVMHAAMPLTDEMIAMLFTYPTLYVDISANDWNMPRAQFYDHLRRLTDAGFTKRILFGSDQTLYPQAVGLAIKTINDAPFLSSSQKRDILYNNAARFLRLSKEEIAADHVSAQ